MQHKPVGYRAISSSCKKQPSEKRNNNIFSRDSLLRLRRRALRQGLWFKALNRVERALVQLTARCIESPSSPRLLAILSQIVGKLNAFVVESFNGLIERLGTPLAERIALLGQRWGLTNADAWKTDIHFIRYLGLRSL